MTKPNLTYDSNEDDLQSKTTSNVKNYLQPHDSNEDDLQLKTTSNIKSEISL
jgi:hypothetical protein